MEFEVTPGKSGMDAFDNEDIDWSDDDTLEDEDSNEGSTVSTAEEKTQKNSPPVVNPPPLLNQLASSQDTLSIPVTKTKLRGFENVTMNNGPSTPITEENLIPHSTKFRSATTGMTAVTDDGELLKKV